MPDTGTGHEYGYPDPSTLDPGPPIQLPAGHGIDDLTVPTGFPHTPTGALAQLAAIDVSALESANLPTARAMIRAWAAPGGPTPGTWSVLRALANLLQEPGLPAAGPPDLRITVHPAMALIKGSVGPDFTIPCIDLAIDINPAGSTTTSTAGVDCQRMQWTGRRWVIGRGPEPAPAPPVWPDTDAAISAGYRDLLTQPR